jgi:REP element-mobilizing transposase RayT
MCRGNREQTVFGSADDCRLFLKTLSEAVGRAGFAVHAYVLMKTHYHLLIETPSGNLVDGMKWLQGAFTQRMNAMHQTWGHLFQGRYKAKVISMDEPGYFRGVADYIHLNPAAAGLAGTRGKPLSSYLWSSYSFYVQVPSIRPEWLVVEDVLNHHGLKDSISDRRTYRELMEGRARIAAGDPNAYFDSEENRGMERGWVHGSKAFRQQMLERLEDRYADALPVYDARQKRDLTERAVQRDLEAGCQFLKLDREKFSQLRKGDRNKVMLAAYIKTNYTLSNQRISELLDMGHPTFISRCRGIVAEDNALKARYEELRKHLFSRE